MTVVVSVRDFVCVKERDRQLAEMVAVGVRVISTVTVSVTSFEDCGDIVWDPLHRTLFKLALSVKMVSGIPVATPLMYV